MTPEVQTQVLVDEEISSEVMTNEAKVSEFRTALSKVRQKRVSIVGELKTLIDKAKAIRNEIGELQFMFKDQATSLYPELATRNIASVVKTLSPVHPLVALEDKFNKKILQQNIRLKSVEDKMSGKMQENDLLAKGEDKILADYKKFYSMSSTPIPTPVELLKQQTQLDAIPMAEDHGQSIVLPALERLDSEAANMVMLQSIQDESGQIVAHFDESNDPYDQGDYYAGELDPVYQSQVENFQTTGIPQMNQGIKTWGLVVGGIALLYVIAGGRK